MAISRRRGPVGMPAVSVMTGFIFAEASRPISSFDVRPVRCLAAESACSPSQRARSSSGDRDESSGTSRAMRRHSTSLPACRDAPPEQSPHARRARW
eukprot:6190011-Pleurochrysis_carterae.AAC.2